MFFRERRVGTPGAARRLPLLTLRDLVVLPLAPVSFIVGRERSLASLTGAMKGDKEIFLAAQRQANTADPNPDDIFRIGTIASVISTAPLPDNTQRVLVEGRRRGRIVQFLAGDDFYRVEVEELNEPVVPPGSLDVLSRTVRQAFSEYIKINRPNQLESELAANAVADPVRLAYELARQLPSLKTADRQTILESNDAAERLNHLLRHLQTESEGVGSDRKAKARNRRPEAPTREPPTEAAREGAEKDEFRSELSELEARIEEKALPPEVKERAARELRKLKLMSPMSAEAVVVRNYLDWIASLPWQHSTVDQIDLAAARKVLDEDHAGLGKVKERILEYLAVVRLVGSLAGPVLCLLGPPGVGKTSLARSIARATGRNFVRVALGGVRDEAEIRGHRRTYIGALPGKIIQGYKRAGSANPVFLLDEIDKMSSDFRGDPSAALLEVLDPEQNSTFNDHYIDLDYNLSLTMFICTANSLQGVPAPLQDRLEVVRIPGYTEAEKLRIARRHLVPRQTRLHGLDERHLRISREAILRMIHGYTREAGVRQLEREIATVCRKVARRVVDKGGEEQTRIDAARLEKMLGVPKYRRTRIAAEDTNGFVNGLAWTPTGGVVVPIEAVVVAGSGKTQLTGQLGQVFKESAEAALTYMRTRVDRLGLEKDFWQRLDVHVHVPELWGVDGPSAGITLATAIVSAACRVPVRRDVAMTGEINLRGQVRPIGGLKEKLLAAVAAGVTRVLIPRDNEAELRELPRGVRDVLEIIPVEHMDQVLALALVTEPGRPRPDEIPVPAEASSVGEVPS